MSVKCISAQRNVYDDVNETSPSLKRDEMSLLHLPMRPLFAAHGQFHLNDDFMCELSERSLYVESGSSLSPLTLFEVVS